MKFVEVLDAITLCQLSIFNHSLYFSNSKQLLGFSPDSRCLTLYTGYEFISWDLQTGGPLGTIPSGLDHRYTIPFSFKHSKDGKVVAVAYKSRDFSHTKYDSFICTYDLLSGGCMGSHRIPEGQMIYPIWTHDGYLRFATIDPKLIRIWQSTFTLEHPPVEVASFPVPGGITDANRFLFLPSLSRLAFTFGGTIQVWDLEASKLLLKSELTLDWMGRWVSGEGDLPWASFSSDGCFFTYTNILGEVDVWKEFPTGYLLHQRLPSFISLPLSNPRPRLSPNSESIIAPLGLKIHRWHTRDRVLSLPSVPTGGRSGRRDFTLGFSLNENLAAFARRGRNTVTIIDLQSGGLKWNANMGVEIDCLGVAGGTVIVVSEDSIVTWNLPGEDRTFDASINNIVRVTILDRSSLSRDLARPYCMSVSTDLSRIVVARAQRWHCSLEVDDVSTGLCLARTTTNVNGALRPLFTQDGCEVWAWHDIHSEKWEQCKITEDGESGAIELKFQSIPCPPRGFFRESPRGYTVTDDWWVLSPSQKRLLWLPHRWRSDGWCRAWGGRFLGLLSGELSEVAILEILE